MEFCLLGPLVVRSAGVVVPVPPGKQRVVLAVLLLNAGRPVAVEELVETLWGPVPPPSARVTLQNYIKRLRHALGDAEYALIRTSPPGYLISIDAGDLDVSRFEVLLRAARAAASGGSWASAAQQARAALALWRGGPLADVRSDVLAQREVPRLAELRLQAAELRMEAGLHLGQHAEMIPELERLATAHPLRERLHAYLMLALYRDGRQGEALAAYQQARGLLVDELGIEPGTELRELHQQILAGDPALALPEPGRPAAGSPIAPRELPRPVAHFTGRAVELAELTAQLDRVGGERSGTLVISAIGGTAGVGKTALAVHWADQVAARFPDGQLYVNLRGYDPAQPMPAADALAGFLRALGVPGQDIPAETDERAARYRSLLAGRRILVVLDNAGSAEQARPLLPGSASCVAVVTSRDSLAGLVARDGAQRLDLDLLPLGEAVRLLRALIGARVDADPAAAATMAGQCARLPLALRIAAELAVARPGVPLASLAAELADQQQRLDLLDAGGDPRTAVRAVFSWSVRHLDDHAARAFRLLGLHPGADFDVYAAAAITGSTLDCASMLLDQLARACLIQPAGPDRYALHDLLRAYAAGQAVQVDAEPDRRAALTRLHDHYLYAAAAAIDTLFPADRHRRPRMTLPASPVPSLTDVEQARAWLDAERANLVAAAAHAAGHGWSAHAIRLAAVLFRHLSYGGYLREIATISGCAIGPARESGDRAAEAAMLANLGYAEWREGRNPQARDHLQRALSLSREIGDRPGEARALANLAALEQRQGRLQQAARHYRRALALRRETGDRVAESRVLNNLAIVETLQGRLHQAARHIRQSVELCRETSNQHGEGAALNNLARIEEILGRYQRAAGYLQQTLSVNRETGDQHREARTLAHVGVVELARGNHQNAAECLRQSLALCHQIGDRAAESEARNGIGEVLLASGRPRAALTEHSMAMQLASQTGDQDQVLRAHYGMACCYLATGDFRKARAGHATALALARQAGDMPQLARVLAGLARAEQAIGEEGQARSHWQEALDLYARLGAPDAAQVRAELAAATGDRESGAVPAHAARAGLSGGHR